MSELDAISSVPQAGEMSNPGKVNLTQAWIWAFKHQGTDKLVEAQGF